MPNEPSPRAAFQTRWAKAADIPAIHAVMMAAIDQLQAGFLSDEQIKASHQIMGLDTQLIDDGTYLLVECEGILVGCGGWSKRKENQLTQLGETCVQSFV